MKELTRLGVVDLLAARQWLQAMINSTTIAAEYVRLAASSIEQVDKELWARLISNNTPWGLTEATICFEDSDFENTLELLRNNCLEGKDPDQE